jgi:hypothetical protein
MAGITIPIISSANGITTVNRASKPIGCAIIRTGIAILNTPTPTRGNDVQLLHYTFSYVIMHCITVKSQLLYSYTSTENIMANNSYSSLETRMEELSRQLNQKDEELEKEVDDIMAADFDALDADIEADKKDLRDGLKQKVEAVKKGIKDRKDELRQRVEEIKKGSKDRARKEAEASLNRMEEHLSNEDLISAYVARWIANQWLKASK